MSSEEIFTIKEKAFFFDTYAFYKIYEGSESYKIYGDSKIITSKLNLFEIYLALLREYGETDADKFFNIYFRRRSHPGWVHGSNYLFVGVYLPLVWLH